MRQCGTPDKLLPFLTMPFVSGVKMTFRSDSPSALMSLKAVTLLLQSDKA
jgi:hypothetical protein